MAGGLLHMNDAAKSEYTLLMNNDGRKEFNS
jgi:hypothetical protein